MENFFKVGKEYTIFRISDFMATTCKQEILVVDIRDTNVIYKNRGKRKLFVLPLEKRDYASAPLKAFDGAVFEGWDQPITCDSELFKQNGGTMRGNACYNFVGSVEAVKTWVEKNQLNPEFDVTRVVAIVDNKEVVVFPELYRGGHAVIERVLEENRKG